ncbi:hypothetical protein Lal_00044811 [Lupinus albus]|nr:hypothetical protein Lal_00044811 [Lupinus albus]
MVASIIHTISTIWYSRNQMRFEDKQIHLSQVMAQIKSFVICKALRGFLAQAGPFAQASHIHAWWKRSCGSLAQARVSPKPKSASRLSERI